jgi:hypothetical protein
LPDSTLQQAEVFASSLNAMWQKNIRRDKSLILLEQSVNAFNIVCQREVVQALGPEGQYQLCWNCHKETEL